MPSRRRQRWASGRPMRSNGQASRERDRGNRARPDPRAAARAAGRLQPTGARRTGVAGAAAAAAHGLWAVDDFRPSEEQRYDALLSAALGEVQQLAEGLLLEALTRALLRFAAEQPGAPRAGHGGA